MAGKSGSSSSTRSWCSNVSKHMKHQKQKNEMSKQQRLRWASICGGGCCCAVDAGKMQKLQQLVPVLYWSAHYIGYI